MGATELYAVADLAMVAVGIASANPVVGAPTDYGTDFRIPQGEALFQIQLTQQEDYAVDSNRQVPRFLLSVLIHHYVTTLVNEKEFVHDTMDLVVDNLVTRSTWNSAAARDAGLYDIEPETDIEISNEGREGNVITFEVTASVLMQPRP